MSSFFRQIAIAALAIVTIVPLNGCDTPKTPQAGFLGDYGQLRPNQDLDGVLHYQNPLTSLSRYNKFIVDGPMIYFFADSKARGLSPEEVGKLSEYFRGEVIRQLTERYQVVKLAGPGVLRLRFALTDLREGSLMLNTHPVTKLSGMGLGGASLEAEAIDTQTGVRVMAVKDSRQGERLSLEGLNKWDHAKQVMRYWVSRFVKQIDQAHGASQSDRS